MSFSKARALFAAFSFLPHMIVTIHAGRGDLEPVKSRLPEIPFLFAITTETRFRNLPDKRCAFPRERASNRLISPRHSIPHRPEQANARIRFCRSMDSSGVRARHAWGTRTLLCKFFRGRVSTTETFRWQPRSPEHRRFQVRKPTLWRAWLRLMFGRARKNEASRTAF